MHVRTHALPFLPDSTDNAIGPRALEARVASNGSTARSVLEESLYKLFVKNDDSKKDMDYFKVIPIKPPSFEEVKRRFHAIKDLDLLTVYGLQRNLEKVYLKNDFTKLSGKLLKDEKALFETLFGSQYLNKLDILPVLPNEEIELLSKVEIYLQIYHDERNPGKMARKSLFRSQLRKVEYTRTIRIVTYWEQVREKVGYYGYRQIAKKIREFLELGEIGIDQAERDEMRAIFRLGEEIGDTERYIMKRLIVCEFKNKLRKEDWFDLWEMDPKSEVFQTVFPDPSGILTEESEIIIRRWCTKRASDKIGEYKRVAKQKRIVDKLVELTFRRPLGTQQWWDFKWILDGDWDAAMAYGLQQKCTTCEAQAIYQCQSCGDAYCGAHYNEN